jgi:hypothetical protein
METATITRWGRNHLDLYETEPREGETDAIALAPFPVADVRQFEAIHGSQDDYPNEDPDGCPQCGNSALEYLLVAWMNSNPYDRHYYRRCHGAGSCGYAGWIHH